MSGQKIRVLFVCLGNICRSPLAEAIFNKKLVEKELKNYFWVDSCSTSDYHIGQDPDPRTIEICQKHDTPISHKARQFSPADFKAFDYIIAMDKSNYKDILMIGGKFTRPEKVFLMQHFDNQGTTSDVPDPYFGEDDGFEEVYNLLEESVENFINFLIEKHETLPSGAKP